MPDIKFCSFFKKSLHVFVTLFSYYKNTLSASNSLDVELVIVVKLAIEPSFPSKRFYFQSNYQTNVFHIMSPTNLNSTVSLTIRTTDCNNVCCKRVK